MIVDQKTVSDAFKQARLAHAWSKAEAGSLSLIRAAYEVGDRLRFDDEMQRLDTALEQKREALLELYRRLFPDEHPSEGGEQ